MQYDRDRFCRLITLTYWSLCDHILKAQCASSLIQVCISFPPSLPPSLLSLDISVVGPARVFLLLEVHLASGSKAFSLPLTLSLCQIFFFFPGWTVCLWSTSTYHDLIWCLSHNGVIIFTVYSHLKASYLWNILNDTVQCHVEEVLRMSDSYTAVVCGVYVLCAALSKAAELLASRQRKHTPLMRRALLNSASNFIFTFYISGWEKCGWNRAEIDTNAITCMNVRRHCRIP